MNAPILAPGAEGEGAGVSLNMSALEEAAEKLNISRVIATSKYGINLPLLFDDFEQEVNFWAISALLSFGTGWQQARPHKYGPEGYPHRDTVTYGLVSLHMGGHALDASDTAAMQAFALAQAFNVPLTKEHRIDGGPIRQDVPSDYKTLLDMWTSALNTVGSELMARGFKSLGAFVLSLDSHSHGSPPSSSSSAASASASERTDAFTASLLVQRLVKVFEALSDEGGEEGSKVKFHRKAQVIAYDLHLRFSHRDARLSFADLEHLTLGADAETGVWFREKGILQLAPSLAAKLDSGKTIAHGTKEEVALRLATARAAVLLSAQLAKLHPDTPVNCAQVGKFMDYLSKIRHRYNVKHAEAKMVKDGKSSEIEPKISEIPDDADTPMEDTSDESPQRQCLFVCKDTPHY